MLNGLGGSCSLVEHLVASMHHDLRFQFVHATVSAGQQKHAGHAAQLSGRTQGGLDLPVPSVPFPSTAELNVLTAQMPQLARAAPAVAAMVAEALRAPIPPLAPMFAPMFAAATASYATPSAQWVPCY